MSSGYQRRLFFVAVTALVGCSSSTDDPPPKQGFSSEKISYDPKPLENAVVVATPAISLKDWPADPVAISLPKALKATEPLAFEGTIDTGDPKLAGGLVYLEFLEKQPDGKNVITTTSQALVSEKGNTDGLIHYRVEVLAPVDKGKQTVELRLMHPGSANDEYRTFARGETVIQ